MARYDAATRRWLGACHGGDVDILFASKESRFWRGLWGGESSGWRGGPISQEEEECEL